MFTHSLSPWRSQNSQTVSKPFESFSSSNHSLPFAVRLISKATWHIIQAFSLYTTAISVSYLILLWTSYYYFSNNDFAWDRCLFCRVRRIAKSHQTSPKQIHSDLTDFNKITPNYSETNHTQKVDYHQKKCTNHTKSFGSGYVWMSLVWCHLVWFDVICTFF